MTASRVLGALDRLQRGRSAVLVDAGAGARRGAILRGALAVPVPSERAGQPKETLT